jgi:signal transduction histidine kinase
MHSIYLHSLTTLLPFLDHEITTIEEEVRFTDVLADLVQQHANTIPVLARGFLEGRKYIDKEHVTTFLDEHLRARIGTRLIAEQHIALHLSSLPHSENHSPDPRTPSTAANTGPPDSYIGIIDTALRPAAILQQTASFVGDLCEFKYGVRPELIINGRPDTTIAHIPSHLEYIFTELLKNAFRATVESGHECDPIEATIAIARPKPGLNSIKDVLSDSGFLDDGSEEDTELLTVRLRDHGGGIAPEHLPQIWGYSFTTFTEQDAAERTANTSASTIDALDTISTLAAGGSTIAGLGYGLPLSRAYAEHFGGGVEVQSLWGWGTDVYLRLRGLRGF